MLISHEQLLFRLATYDKEVDFIDMKRRLETHGKHPTVDCLDEYFVFGL